MENEFDEHASIIRRTNKALRTVNKQLRNALKKSREHADEIFLHLCETPASEEIEKSIDAETAMEKLRTFGGFQCGPRNYDFIVEMCLRALEDSETLSHRPEAAMQKTLERQQKSFICQGNIGEGGLPSQ